MQKNSLIIAVVFLIAGFVAAHFIYAPQQQHSTGLNDTDTTDPVDKTTFANPFSVKGTDARGSERLSNLENEVFLLKQKLEKMDIRLIELTDTAVTNSAVTPPVTPPVNSNRKRYSSALTQRLYNIDNLIRGGIDASLAEDIVRRKNSIELKRLALQDLATRENYLNTQRYFDELAEINEQDVILREELGDERYDEYLFNSKQNNRIRISSVMLGSAAEQAGIQKGDIVLSYDSNRMFSWQELKDATAEGQLGEYVSISIYRKGEIYSFSVPRGPLGMQLGATRLTP